SGSPTASSCPPTSAGTSSNRPLPSPASTRRRVVPRTDHLAAASRGVRTEPENEGPRAFRAGPCLLLGVPTLVLPAAAVPAPAPAAVTTAAPGPRALLAGLRLVHRQGPAL